MASNITLTFDAPGAGYTDVREALSGLTDDDVSVSSPISEGGSEAAVVVDGNTIEVRVDGHEGDWTKKSQNGVVSAIEAVDGVEECTSIEGGYEKSEESEESE